MKNYLISAQEIYDQGVRLRSKKVLFRTGSDRLVCDLDLNELSAVLEAVKNEERRVRFKFLSDSGDDLNAAQGKYFDVLDVARIYREIRATDLQDALNIPVNSVRVAALRDPKGFHSALARVLMNVRRGELQRTGSTRQLQLAISLLDQIRRGISDGHLDVLGHEVSDTPSRSLTQRRPPGAVGDV